MATRFRKKGYSSHSSRSEGSSRHHKPVYRVHVHDPNDVAGGYTKWSYSKPRKQDGHYVVGGKRAEVVTVHNPNKNERIAARRGVFMSVEEPVKKKT